MVPGIVPPAAARLCYGVRNVEVLDPVGLFEDIDIQACTYVPRTNPTISRAQKMKGEAEMNNIPMNGEQKMLQHTKRYGNAVATLPGYLV